MDIGLRRENATKQRDRAPFRFNRNGKTIEYNYSKQELNKAGGAWPTAQLQIEVFVKLS